MTHPKSAPRHYHVPHASWWPLFGSLGLAGLAIGFARLLNGDGLGAPVMFGGAALLLVMLFGWFGNVIRESLAGRYNAQVDRSFRYAMAWFIFSEVMFFGAFFGALLFARLFAVPWLGDDATHAQLWPDFQAAWPLLKPPAPDQFSVPRAAMEAWGVPALNTFVLLTSAFTVTWAHWGLVRERQDQLLQGLVGTVILGLLFLALQAHEYGFAYEELNLRLDSGIYGSTFFMLTGFHGAHVALGVTLLGVILLRARLGHFTPTEYFAFQAASWYWHFVDLVWLTLVVLVYWW